MRKLIVALTLAAGSFYAAQAQKPYIRLGFGYGFPQAGQTRDIDGMPLNGTAAYSTSVGFTDLNLKKASYASGCVANLALGVMINANIGIELNGIVGVVPIKYGSDITINDNGTSYHENFKQYVSTPILLTPSLLLQTGKKVHCYMRAGIVLPVRTQFVNIGDVTFNDQHGLTHWGHRNVTYYTAFCPGLSGALGLDFKLMKHLRFFTEAHLLSMSLYLKQAHIDNPSATVTYRTQSHGGPTEAGTYSLPFSSIGGNGGLIFEL